MTTIKEKKRKKPRHKNRQLRSFWKSRILEGGVQKLETGIVGFDELLEGGLPEGRVTLFHSRWHYFASLTSNRASLPFFNTGYRSNY